MSGPILDSDEIVIVITEHSEVGHSPFELGVTEWPPPPTLTVTIDEGLGAVEYTVTRGPTFFDLDFPSGRRGVYRREDDPGDWGDDYAGPPETPPDDQDHDDA